MSRSSEDVASPLPAQGEHKSLLSASGNRCIATLCVCLSLNKPSHMYDPHSFQHPFSLAHHFDLQGWPGFYGTKEFSDARHKSLASSKASRSTPNQLIYGGFCNQQPDPAYAVNPLPPWSVWEEEVGCLFFPPVWHISLLWMWQSREWGGQRLSS